MRSVLLLLVAVSVVFAGKQKEFSVHDWLKGNWDLRIDSFSRSSGEPLAADQQVARLNMLADNSTMKFYYYVNATDGKKDERDIRIVFPGSRLEADIYSLPHGEEPTDESLGKLINLSVQRLFHGAYGAFGKMGDSTFQLAIINAESFTFTVSRQSGDTVTVISAKKVSVGQPPSLFQRFQMPLMMMGIYVLTSFFKKKPQEPAPQPAPADAASTPAPAPTTGSAPVAAAEADREHKD